MYFKHGASGKSECELKDYFHRKRRMKTGKERKEKEKNEKYNLNEILSVTVLRKENQSAN